MRKKYLNSSEFRPYYPSVPHSEAVSNQQHTAAGPAGNVLRNPLFGRLPMGTEAPESAQMPVKKFKGFLDIGKCQTSFLIITLFPHNPCLSAQPPAEVYWSHDF